MSSFSRNQVLAALRAAGGKSLHVMEVLGALGAPKTVRDEVRDTLHQLKELGLVKELPGNRFKAAAPRRAGSTPEIAASARPPREQPERPRRAPALSSERPRASVSTPAFSSRSRDDERPRAAAPRGVNVAGWLTISARGFGFVSADDGGPDVFIAARSLGFAMHGDRVEVVTRPSDRGREGDVVRVLERGMLRVAGVLVRANRGYVIEPRDARLPEYFRVTGSLPLETEAGTDVVAQITKYVDGPGDVPEARVLKTLGPRGSAEVEIAKILIRENVAEEFPADVVQEALGFPAEVPAHDVAEREDLRHLDLVTIDPADARDHDDALWAERLEDGSYRVVIAIADVSHYVRSGSAIDRAALARGTSIYLPGRAIPMLPPELSSNLASLVPNEDRLTLAVEVHIGKLGRILSHRVIEGVMRSRARLTYGGVARALGLSEEPAAEPEAEARLPLLRTLHAISRRLRAIRTRRGALEFQLPEAKIVLGKDGEPKDVIRSRSDAGIKESYEIVEDLMLLANEVIAEDLSRRRLPTIYRIHGKPDANKVATFAAVAEAFGHALDEDAGESPRKLQQFLAKIAGTPNAQSLSYLLLRAMQQASYDTNNVGHFALAARDYLHFTSPIRRYPDLAVHRVVRALARNERIDVELLQKTLAVQAQQSSRMERRSMTVEREAQNLYRCILMKDRVGEELAGTITGVTEHGVWVSLNEPFVEVRIPVERLGEDFYTLDRLGIRLVGKRSGHTFALGQPIVVRIESVSIEKREIAAVPMSLPESRRGAKMPKGAPERPSRSPRGERAGPERPTRSTSAPRKSSSSRARPERPKKRR